MYGGDLGESDTDDNRSETENPGSSRMGNRHQVSPARTLRKSATERSTTARKPIVGAARRKLRSQQLKQLKEIRKFQSTTNLLIPRASFGRLVREISFECNPNITRYTYTAIEAIQEATEMFLVQLLEDAYLLTMHRKCVTLGKSDILLIRLLKRN